MRVWGSAEALLLSCCVVHGALIWFLCPVGLDQSLWVWGVVSVWCFLLSLIGGQLRVFEMMSLLAVLLSAQIWLCSGFHGQPGGAPLLASKL